MKNKSILNSMLLVLFIVTSITVRAEEAKQATSTKAVQNTAASNIEADLGYFFGYSFGNMLKEGGNTKVDMEALAKGMQDALGGADPALTEVQQTAVINAVKTRRAELQKQQEQTQLQDGASFLANNSKEEGVKQTGSGLQYKVVIEGTGNQPVATDVVVVHYAGKLLNGVEFDSSIKRGQPAEFTLNQVIAGWTEGLQLMKAGGKTRFFIPSDLAYGPSGTRGIPPHSVLIFDVELLEVK